MVNNFLILFFDFRKFVFLNYILKISYINNLFLIKLKQIFYLDKKNYFDLKKTLKIKSIN